MKLVVYTAGFALVSCFSPVAGILLVETLKNLTLKTTNFCFSPVAGILLVETPPKAILKMQKLIKFQSRCRDSVS